MFSRAKSRQADCELANVETSGEGGSRCVGEAAAVAKAVTSIAILAPRNSAVRDTHVLGNRCTSTTSRQMRSAVAPSSRRGTFYFSFPSLTIIKGVEARKNLAVLLNTCDYALLFCFLIATLAPGTCVISNKSGDSRCFAISSDVGKSSINTSSKEASTNSNPRLSNIFLMTSYFFVKRN